MSASIGDLRALSGLVRLQSLDLRGNVVRSLAPLQAPPALDCLHVGGSGIESLAPVDDVPGLTVHGKDEPRNGDRPSESHDQNKRHGR